MPAVQRGDGAHDVVVALLPHEPPGRDDRVLRGRRIGRREREAPDVDAGGAHEHALLLDALQAQRLRGALGGGQEQVGLGEHELAVDARVAVAEGDHVRQRLPHGLHEAEAVAAAALGGLGGEPEAELGAVHDVRAGEGLLAEHVAVADDPRAHLPERPGRHQVAQRPRPPRAQAGGRHVAVGAAQQVGHVEALGQLQPRPQLPRGGQMAAHDEDGWHGRAHYRGHPRRPAGGCENWSMWGGTSKRRAGLLALPAALVLAIAAPAGASIDVSGFVAGPSIVEGGLMWSGTQGVSLSSAHGSRLIARTSEVAASELALDSVHVEDDWTVVAAASLRVGRTGAPLHSISGLALCGPGARARWLAGTAGGYVYTIVRGDCVGRAAGQQILVRIRLGTGTVEALGVVPSQAMGLAVAGGRVALTYEDPDSGRMRVDVVSAANAKGLYSFSDPSPLTPGRGFRYEGNEQTQLDAAGDVVVTGGANLLNSGGGPYRTPAFAWWGNGASRGARWLGEMDDVTLSDGRIAYAREPGEGAIDINVRDLASGRASTIVKLEGIVHVLGVGLRGEHLAWAEQSSQTVAHRGSGGSLSCETLTYSPLELREADIAAMTAPLVIEGPHVPPPAL